MTDSFEGNNSTRTRLKLYKIVHASQTSRIFQFDEDLLLKTPLGLKGAEIDPNTQEAQTLVRKRERSKALLVRESEILTLLNQSGAKHFLKITSHPLYTNVISMERLKGVNLAKKMRDTPASPQAMKEFLFIFSQVVEALEELYLIEYEGKLIQYFGDLKPDQVMITLDYKVYMVDPALAGYQSEEDLVFGHPDWISPEQLIQGWPLTTAIDAFSLGIMLYTLLTKRHPFFDKNTIKNSSEKQKELIKNQYIPLTIEEIRPWLHSSTTELVLKGIVDCLNQLFSSETNQSILCQDPAGRIETPRQVLEYFTEVINPHISIQTN